MSEQILYPSLALGALEPLLPVSIVTCIVVYCIAVVAKTIFFPSVVAFVAVIYSIVKLCICDPCFFADVVLLQVGKLAELVVTYLLELFAGSGFWFMFDFRCVVSMS